MKNLKQDFKKFANSKGIPSTTLLDYENKGFIPSIYNSMSADPNNLTPYIYEQGDRKGTMMDVFSRLMMDSTIFLGTGVGEEISNIIVAQLLFLDSQIKKDITMFISSPGGSVYAGNGIIDTMNYINQDISTINISLAASMGAVILSNGTKGKRFALPLSRTMIHQVSSGTEGTFSDMKIAIRETESVKKDLYEVLAINTGKTVEQIEKDCDRDYWMKSQEACDYGLVDQVIVSLKKK